MAIASGELESFSVRDYDIIHLSLMERKNIQGPLLDHFDNIEAKCAEGSLSLRELFDILGPEGHYLLVSFLTVPFLQPIPMPGLSTPFGLLIAVVAGLAYFGKPPWIPNRWAKRKISARAISQISFGTERILKKFTFIHHPRWQFLFRSPFRLPNATLLIANAILLALPLPIPFSNTIPALVILFQALAHLEKDGLFVILSYAQTLFCLVYFYLIGKGMGLGFEMLKDTISKSYWWN